MKPAPARQPSRPRAGGSVAYWVRWLHTYLSLFAFAALLFFAVTGLTVNHPDWFYQGVRSTEVSGSLPAKLAQNFATATQETPAATSISPAVQSQCIEFLRRQHHVGGTVSEFRTDDIESVVAFKGPGYSAEAVVDRQTGQFRLTESKHGIVSVINDLHKGRDSGAAWSLVIDLSAVLMVIASVTGIWLVLYLKRRVAAGLITAAIGTIALAAVYWLCVP
jgi:hypothetical protein